jgi:hypothetical protein
VSAEPLRQGLPRFQSPRWGCETFAAVDKIGSRQKACVEAEREENETFLRAVHFASHWNAGLPAPGLPVSLFAMFCCTDQHTLWAESPTYIRRWGTAVSPPTEASKTVVCARFTSGAGAGGLL